MKTSLDCSRGALVEANGRRYRILNDALGFKEVQALDLSTGRHELLSIVDLRSVEDASDEPEDAPDLSTMEGAAFEEAVRRKRAIDRLLDLPKRRRDDVKQCAAGLGVSVATVYRWIRTYRIDDRATTLAPRKRSGGRGASRLTPDAERLLQVAITEHHNTPKQLRVSATFRFLKRLCKKEGVKPPHENTVRFRIKAIDQETYLKARGQSKLARERFTPHPGHYEEATQPLAVVQIDHTQVDVILVDEERRLPLKRPWITVAFDVYSRMVLGFYISFDSPGAYGTGLSLYRAIAPKEKWLGTLGVETDWPCWGFPLKIHTDNAREFRGDMLKRACEQYGMSIAYRALKKPEYGGHIERWLGTFAQELHELPGGTMKPADRGDYNPEADAAMTLKEFEAHVAKYITGVYHQEFHTGIDSSPLKRWTDAILGDGEKLPMGIPSRPTNEERLRLDLMPFEERTIQDYGVQIGDIRYYDDVLRRYIGRKPSKLYTFRYDPRDIKTIFFWDPELRAYYELHYGNIRHPSISIWELKAVRKHLRDIGRKNVDEDLIFKTYEQLRASQDESRAETKRVRHIQERKKSLERNPKPSLASTAKPKLTLVPPVAAPGSVFAISASMPAPKRFGYIQPLEADEDDA